MTELCDFAHLGAGNGVLRQPQWSGRPLRWRLRSTLVLCLAGLFVGLGGAGCHRDIRGESGASAEVRTTQLKAFGHRERPALIRRLAAMVAIPSRTGVATEVDAMAAALTTAFTAVGFDVENLAAEGPPLLLATGGNRAAKRTLLFYAHYDGQRVNPERWQHCEPFVPVLYDRDPSAPGAASIEIDTIPETLPATAAEWRLCGRAAADDKGPIAVLLEVLRGLHDGALGPTSVGVKVLLDGDEESGSRNLAAMLAQPKNQTRLGADVLLSLDGPGFANGKPTLFFGVRGLVALDLITYGGDNDLHSGHYGNWAPNPALELAALLASMKDPHTGEVMIAGFSDCRTALAYADELALQAIPDLDQALKVQHGLGRLEGQRALKQAITYPSLNVRGLAAGNVGSSARTVIPATAEAAIDIRLVKGCSADGMHALVRAHLEGLGYRVLDGAASADERRAHPRLVSLMRRPSHYQAVRTPTDWPLATAIAEVVAAATGEAPVKVPTIGGSLPFYLFEQHVGTPLIGLPLVNHDNHQHSPNENVRLGHLFRGFDVLATLLLQFD